MRGKISVMAFQTKRMPTRYNHHTIPMEKVLQAQTKSSLAKSRNQDEDPCPNLPEYIDSESQMTLFLIGITNIRYFFLKSLKSKIFDI